MASETDEDEELKDNLMSLKTAPFTLDNNTQKKSQTNLNDVTGLTGFNSDISQLPHDRTIIDDPNSALKVKNSGDIGKIKSEAQINNNKLQ